MYKSDLKFGDIVTYKFQEDTQDSNGVTSSMDYLLAGIILKLDVQSKYGIESVEISDLKVLKGNARGLELETMDVDVLDIIEVVSNALDPLYKKFPEYMI